MTETERLGLQMRRWRAVACCLAVLAVPWSAVLAQDKPPADTERPAELATLEIPERIKLDSTSADQVELYVDQKKHIASGMATLVFSDGIRLKVPTAKVTFTSGAPGEPRHVVITP